MSTRDNRIVEDVLAMALEAKNEVDKQILSNQRTYMESPNCHWSGSKFVHLEPCNCDWWEDADNEN